MVVGSLQGDLALWSPAQSLGGRGVHTGTVRGRCISRLLLLRLVGFVAGPRPAGARSPERFGRTRKR